MKKILSTTAIAGSLCLLGTSAFAQFVGPYAGISLSGAGFAIDASKRSSNANSDGAGNGPVGAVFGLAAFDVGYSMPAGKGTTIALGATYTPMKADFTGKSNDARTEATGTGTRTGASHTFEIKDAYTIYLQPTFEINKDASFFVKGFYSKADVSATNLTTAPNDLEGWGGSVGLQVMLTKNAFVRAEAAYTQFDTISATKLSTSGQTVGIEGHAGTTTVTRTFTANDPELVEGRITVGFKF